MTPKHTPMLDDLVKITKHIREVTKGFRPNDISITFKIKDKETLNKINEDYYYRNNPTKLDENVNEVDEINIIVNGIKVIYLTE